MQVHSALVHGLKIRHVIVGHGLLTVGVAPNKPLIAPGSNDAESRKLLLDRFHGCVIYFYLHPIVFSLLLHQTKTTNQIAVVRGLNAEPHLLVRIRKFQSLRFYLVVHAGAEVQTL